MIDILTDHKQLDNLLSFLYDNKNTKYSWRRVKKEHLPNESMDIIKLWLQQIIDDKLIKADPCAGFGRDEDFFIMQGNELSKKFLDSGGYTKLFNDRETNSLKENTKSTTNIFKDSTIGQVNQNSNFSNSPNKIKTAAAPRSNPDRKSSLRKIFSSPWTIAFAVLLIEELTLSKIYKYIISLF